MHTHPLATTLGALTPSSVHIFQTETPTHEKYLALDDLTNLRITAGEPKKGNHTDSDEACRLLSKV